MPETVRFPDLMAFVVLPYVALGLAVIGTIERYRRHPFSCSSHSTQLLENRLHFWGEVPFHYGIILALAGHLVVALAPQSVLAWTGVPAGRVAIEGAALASGLLAAVGMTAIIVRRLRVLDVRRVTGALDWCVYGLLAAQIAGGVAVAVLHPWGASWFASSLTPYLWSLARFQPDASVVAAMPPLVKLHVATAWTLLALFPYSRLVHVAAVPNPYLWRRPQVVRWSRRALQR